MDDCIFTLLVVIIFMLLLIIISGILGTAWVCVPSFRRRCMEKFTQVKKNTQNIPNIDNDKYINDIFNPQKRVQYYLGDLKKPMFIKLYEKNFNPNTFYIINSSILDDNSESLSNNYIEEMKTYYTFFKRRHPEKHDKQFILVIGDISHSRKDLPILSKTRPITNPGKNVILPLNNRRHWEPISYVKMHDIPYESKKNIAIWRGATTAQKNRENFVKMYYNYPGHQIDVGFSNLLKSYTGDKRLIKNKMSMGELLQNKFIISIEGNDVASNLKWIMASNSLCIMPKPKTESWLMEGLLIPWVHYVPIKDTYEDLPKIYTWCIENPEICKKIVNNCNSFINRFMDGENEFNIIDNVLDKYSNMTTIL